MSRRVDQLWVTDDVVAAKIRFLCLYVLLTQYLSDVRMMSLDGNAYKMKYHTDGYLYETTPGYLSTTSKPVIKHMFSV